ncbi:aminotransferase-like domain-containing protein [Phytomonospora endophytica]|uniref:DNA-binding transcriptional MocR family regulator n=1 Tax=Phytomonospora endophytica TaxID=714109 RepID=A0A841G3B7_9ACTN|nr:PLP-dependent aminotransferase family protein [Phytomonospora endophytica]MBB6038610.1 DNA-binding transcriptional MocR family regulator [Phytomonospora endophytica]GIG69246.1 transcriptional regulator [Phytomonospora endophytica]
MSESSTSADLLATLRALVAAATPGDRLPSSRELVLRHHVSPVTVARAIALLATEGLVVTRPGSGTYVAGRGRAGVRSADTGWQTVALTDRTVDTRAVTDGLGPPPSDAIVLDGGYLHRSLQPTSPLGAALARAARRPDAWDRAPSDGLASLRGLFARMTGADVDADDVLIVSGGQNGLSVAFRAIAGPGDPVLMESPTYPGAIAAARAAGLRPVPVPVDHDGLRPELLAEAFAMTGARLLYCQPAHHNPTGVVLSPERREQVVAVARAAGAFVVEDDFARHLGHGGTQPRPLIAEDHDGTVVHLTSLSKPAAPSLRIAALTARGPVMERMRAVGYVDAFFIPRPLQEAALELLSSPGWERHLRSLAAALRDRCRVLCEALAVHCPEWTIERTPVGGLHLWAGLPSGVEETAFAAAARREGIAVGTGRRFFPAEPSGAFLRLGFAAAAETATLAEGVRRLAALG